MKKAVIVTARRRAYLRALPKRLGKSSLSITEEKSSLVNFDRRELEQSGKFTFLCFYGVIGN